MSLFKNFCFICRKFISCLVIFAFTITLITPSGAFADASVSSPGESIISLSDAAYTPALLKGIQLRPENALEFDFIVETGDSGLQGEAFQKEARRLIKYFLASLTIPEDEMWVNLSPYEADRIAPEKLATTELGRDLLAQDFMLKQLTASLVYPDSETGRNFWERVHKLAYERFGVTEIPLETFNKVWIVPRDAVVYEKENVAYVAQSHLEVMLEEDYVASYENDPRGAVTTGKKSEDTDVLALGTEVLRDVIIPEIEREVNEGEHFARLRQIYNAAILSGWFKIRLKESLVGQVYADQNKIQGIDLNDPQARQRIYEQYLEAYRKGAYQHIREDYDPLSQQVVPRKYFSGGVRLTQLADMAMLNITSDPGVLGQQDLFRADDANMVRAALTEPGEERTVDAGMLADDSNAQIRDALDEQRTQLLAEVADPGTSEARREIAQASIARIEARIRALSEPDLRAQQDSGMLSYNRNLDVVLPEERTRTTQFNEDITRALESLGRETESKSVFLVGEEGADVTFGAVYDSETDEVYIERSLVRVIEERENPAGMKTRVFVYLLTEGDERARRRAEYEYARDNFPEVYNNLLPERSGERTFDDLIAGVSRNIMGIDVEVDRLKSDLGLPDDIVFEGHEDLTVQDHSQELLTIGETALYQIAINALNKTTDLNKTFRIHEDDPAVSDNVRAGMLAFAANPITNAHSLVAVLKAMAEAEVDVFFVSPTKGDFRKPALEATYEQRLRMAREYFEQTTGGLIRVMPALTHERPRGQGVNGEEKILSLLEMNQEATEATLFYGAGADHFFSFAREKDGMIKFVTISETNRKDLEYYVRLGGYPQLLRLLLEHESSAIPEDKRDLIRSMAETDSPEDRIALLQDAESLPVLDTVGKLYLIEQDSPNPNFKMAMLNTSRGEQPVDILRENLGIEVVFNEGASFDISATKLRKGIEKLFRERVFDFTLFEAMPVVLFEEILRPENREYLYSLLRISNTDLPNAVDVLFPADLMAEGERHDALIAELQGEVENVQSGLTVSEGTEGNTSFITLSDPQGNEAFRFEYSVRNGLTPQAGGDNSVIRQNVTSGDRLLSGEEIALAVEDYVLKYNKAENLVTSDAGMISSEEENVGGIDLDLRGLQIERDGNGVPLPVDMQSLERLRVDFQGFFPVIIDVVPVNVPMLLGLVQEGEPVESAQDDDTPSLAPSDYFEKKEKVQLPELSWR